MSATADEGPSPADLIGMITRPVRMTCRREPASDEQLLGVCGDLVRISLLDPRQQCRVDIGDRGSPADGPVRVREVLDYRNTCGQRDFQTAELGGQAEAGESPWYAMPGRRVGEGVVVCGAQPRSAARIPWPAASMTSSWPLGTATSDLPVAEGPARNS